MACAQHREPAPVAPFCDLSREQWLIVARRNHPAWTDEQLELAWRDFARMKREDG